MRDTQLHGFLIKLALFRVIQPFYTDLYLQIYRSVERVCCLLVLNTVTSTPVDSMDNATLAGQNRAVSGSLRMHPGQTIPAPCKPAAQQLSLHQQPPLQHTHEWSLGQLVMMMSFICSCRNNKLESSSMYTLRKVHTIRGCLEDLTLMI